MKGLVPIIPRLHTSNEPLTPLMDFKLSLCKNIIIPKQTYIVNMLLMAMAAGTGLMLYRFFKLSEGSLSNLCLGVDICIFEHLLKMRPALLLIYTKATKH